MFRLIKEIFISFRQIKPKAWYSVGYRLEKTLLSRTLGHHWQRWQLEGAPHRVLILLPSLLFFHFPPGSNVGRRLIPMQTLLNLISVL